MYTELQIRRACMRGRRLSESGWIASLRTKRLPHLGSRGICAWSGNFYALSLTERLGIEDHGGLLRLGLVHYNTAEEVDRVLKELASIA